MKKFCLILLSVMLLIALAVPALAADVKLTAAVSATTVQTGDEVVVTISSSGTTPFTALGLFIEYDTSVFEYKSRSWGVAIIDATTKSFDETSGKVTAVWDEAGAYSGEIIKITLTVKGITPGNTSIKFGDLSCKNENSNITIEGSSAQVSLICEHDYGDGSWTPDGDKHKKVCTKCSTPVTEGHTWDEGELISPASCTADGQEKYTCEICQATKTETITKLGHQWDNDCDTTCNRKDCGYTRETSHSYRSTWTSDKTGHWHECRSCGDKKDFAAHTPSAEATYESAQTCTVCKYEITPKLEHVHKISEGWDSDSESHWHRCENNKPTICDHKESEAAHDYDDACDVDCNTCGYTRIPPHNYSMEWRGSVSGHWHVCMTCGAQSDVTPHTPGPEATQDTPQVCEECNFTIMMELSHVHEFGEDWYSDDENHWQSCTNSQCYQTNALEPHTWDEGVELSEGGIQYTCSICAKQVVMDEPIGTQPSTVPSTGSSTEPSATQKPTEPSGSGSFPWEWAGVAAIVLLIVGVVLLVIEFIRSRKTNMHGKFSK